MKKILSFIFLMFIFLINTKAQDQIVNARNVNIQITNPNVAGGGAGSVAWNSINAAYVLAPLGPDYGFCMSVVNNNPTNAHTFTINAFQTGDNGVIDYSHNIGRYASLAIIGLPSPVPANSTNTFFVRSNGAAKIAFVISGAGTLAGNPDTVDIYAVQTTADGCGTVNPQTGQRYTLATPNTGTSAAPPVMAVSDGLHQSYEFSSAATNPANNQVIAGANANNGTRQLFFDKVIITTSAAAIYNIFLDTTNSTCGTSTPTSLNMSGVSPSGTTPSTGIGFSGVCSPTRWSNGPIQVQVGAGQSITIDLKGLIAANGTTNGIDVEMGAALTGNTTVVLFWYEK